MNYTRKEHIITDTDTGKSTTFPSINKAKQESRRLQNSGATVRVIKPEDVSHGRKSS